jgi:glycosyltransferase involved in cell wall biosynthesis
MNILVFSWRDPKHPLAGGAEQVMHEHMQGWLAAGHFVTLFSSRFSGSKKSENLDGVEIMRYGNQLGTVFVAGFFWYLFGKHPKYDFVVDQFHGMPFFTPLYVRRPKLAILQEVAREVWFKNDLPFPANYLYGIVGYFLEPLIFRIYRNVQFMVGSNSARGDLVKMGVPGANITVVPHGVIVEKPKILQAKEKIKTVVYLGALAKDKGIEDALKVFSLLNGKGNFNFWVIGKGGEPYLTFLKKLCKNLGIDGKTKFWGYVSQKLKFSLLAKSHVMINPSVREGWGLVNIEANAMGVPVVAYQSPGLIDSVKNGESGLICSQNSAGEMADLVLNLLNDRSLYVKLQKGAVLWSKRFSWEQSKKRSLTLIDSIV